MSRRPAARQQTQRPVEKADSQEEELLIELEDPPKLQQEEDPRLTELVQAAADLVSNTSATNAVVFNNVANNLGNPIDIAIASGYKKPKAVHITICFFSTLAELFPSPENFAVISQAYQLQYVILSRIGWQHVPLLSSSISTSIPISTLVESADLSRTLSSLKSQNASSTGKNRPKPNPRNTGKQNPSGNATNKK